MFFSGLRLQKQMLTLGSFFACLFAMLNASLIRMFHFPAFPAAHKERTDPIMLLRVATLAAISVASVNAAAILETYPLTADCDVRSPFEPLVGFPRDK
jgi:hypothetical protein